MIIKSYRIKDILSKVVDNRGRNTNYYDCEKYPIIDNYMIKNELHPDLETATRFLSEEQFNTFLRGYIAKDDLLMTLVGNGIGNVTLSPHSNCAIIQNTIGMAFDKCICDQLFLYYYFKIIQTSVRNLDRGSSQPSVNREDIFRIRIQLPKIAVQKKIASILSAYDNLIEVNNKRIKALEQMAENLYKEWFVRFRFPGHETAEFENGVPKGWEEKRLEQFGISLDSGSRPSGGVDDSLEDGMPSLGAEAVNGLGEFDYNNVKLIPFLYYDQMKRGKNTGRDILVYKDGAYIGKTTIFMNGFPYAEFAVNEHVFLLNAIKKEYQFYLYFTLHLPEYFALMQNLNRNAAQPGLSKPDMNRIKMVVPNIETVRLFNETIEPILAHVFGLALQTRNLTKQRDLLLPRLMSGKLEA